MTPREFLDTIVRPTINDFHTHFSDLRHAYHAISDVDALAAHLYVWAKTNNTAGVLSSSDDTAYRADLAARDQSFALLRDIAKAQKHVQLTRGNPQVSRASQVMSRALGYGEGPWGEGRFGGVDQVVVEIDASNLAYVETIVDDALSFLEREMLRLGA